MSFRKENKEKEKARDNFSSPCVSYKVNAPRAELSRHGSS